MSVLKIKVDELGYDIPGLSDLIYVPAGLVQEDSCDGGCTTRCISCKVDSKN